MYLNSFSLRVPEGTEIAGGYVIMEHNKKYTLVLRNDWNTECDARVEIDGKHVGTWRIDSHSNMRIERPAHDDGRFTFYKAGSKKAKKIGLDSRDPSLGLIKVVFTPAIQPCYYFTPIHICECPPQPPCWTIRYSPSTCGDTVFGNIDASKTLNYSGGTYTAANTIMYNSVSHQQSANLDAGGTGLSGKSDQEFENAGDIFYDYSRQSTIHLRLVSSDNKDPRPLTQYSTPIPPSVR